MKKYSYILIILVLIIFTIVVKGLFPIAKVNGERILYIDFAKYENAFENFRLNIVNSEYEEILKFGFEKIPEEVLDRTLMEELIIRKVLEERVREELGPKIKEEIISSLEEELSRANESHLKDVAKNLYGLGYEDFKEIILLPENREVIVRKYIEAEGKDYNEWLSGHLIDSDVKVYFYSYKWVNGVLVDE